MYLSERGTFGRATTVGKLTFERDAAQGLRTHVRACCTISRRVLRRPGCRDLDMIPASTMNTTTLPISLDDVQAASHRIAGHVRRTPALAWTCRLQDGSA